MKQGPHIATPDPRRPIADQLADFGPGGPGARSVPLAQALDYARALTGARRENFTVLSALVPTELRDDFASVYAFCRWADDLSDEARCPGVHASSRARDAAAMARDRDYRLKLLGWWRSELDLAIAGRPRHPVMVALAHTLARRHLSAAPFHRLLDAFEQDQCVNVYSTWDELVGYCERSANPVGEIVLNLAGVTREAHPQLLALSDAACTALQITNHLQDLRRDLLERDRLYIPEQLTGLDAPALRVLAGTSTTQSRAKLWNALLPVWQRTQALYGRSAPLPGLMRAHGAGHLAPLVWLLIAGGRNTHAQLARKGLRGLWRRDALSKTGAGVLVMAALVRRTLWRSRRASTILAPGALA